MKSFQFYVAIVCFYSVLSALGLSGFNETGKAGQPDL